MYHLDFWHQMAQIEGFIGSAIYRSVGRIKEATEASSRGEVLLCLKLREQQGERGLQTSENWSGGDGTVQQEPLLWEDMTSILEGFQKQGG